MIIKKIITSFLLTISIFGLTLSTTSCGTKLTKTEAEIRENSTRAFALYDTKTGKEISFEDISKIESRKNTSLFFFGEFHDDKLIHQLKNNFLTLLMTENNNKVAVSMEMFERDVQPIMDSYLSGDITQDEFLKKSRPWGVDYPEFYGPLVETAKNNNSAVICANIPRNYASIYAKEGMTGINKLPANERIFISKKLDIVEDTYRDNFFESMITNLGIDTEKEITPNQENSLQLYYGAQCLKDETMAESIYNFFKQKKSKYQGYKVVHFNGDFHSRDDLGTVQKFQDLDKDKEFNISVITPVYVDKGTKPDFLDEYKGSADYVLVLEEKPADDQMRMMGGHLSENAVVEHNIDITLDPANHSIIGKDILKFKSPIIKTGTLSLIKDLKIKSITSEDGIFKYEITKHVDSDIYNQIKIIPEYGNEISNLVITYSGKLNYSPSERNLKQTHSSTEGMISDKKGEGIYLPAGAFYPYADKDMANFKLQVNVPNEFEMVTSGLLEKIEKIRNNTTTYHYKTESKIDNIILIGGKFNITDKMYDGRIFSVYTFKDGKNNNPDTNKKYLDESIEYYKMYKELLGDYPYSSFSVVENFFASGFGMPGYTLLSNQLMSMPWILLSPGSLAHEFVHNWFGNSVFVKRESGNWCEAITVFSTNYYYHILKGNPAKAIDFRKGALMSIANLPEDANYPLTEFEYQKNSDDAVIGYDKGAMIFNEIYKLMGKEHFFGALRAITKKYKGKRASWMSFIYTFKSYIKKNKLDIPIRKVFRQWIDTKEIPEISLDKSLTLQTKDSLTLVINQDLEYYMQIPVKLITAKNDTINKDFIIKKKSNKFTVKIDEKIKTILLDPDYNVLRKLNKFEMPFNFSNNLNDNPLIILPSKKAPFTIEHDIALQFGKEIRESGYEVYYKSCDDITPKDWENRSILVIGSTLSNSFINKNLKENYPKDISEITTEKAVIKGKDYSLVNNLMVANFEHPKNEDKTVSLITYNKLFNEKQFKRLFHYIKNSLLIISQTKRGRPVLRSEIFPIEPKDNPLKLKL